MNVGPYMPYIFCICRFFILYKKRGFGSPKCHVHASPFVFAIKMAEFVKLEHFFKTNFET